MSSASIPLGEDVFNIEEFGLRAVETTRYFWMCPARPPSYLCECLINQDSEHFTIILPFYKMKIGQHRALQIGPLLPLGLGDSDVPSSP